jgi:cell division protein FtsW
MTDSKSSTLGPPDWILLSATIALVSVGLMMVYSSTSYSAAEIFGDSTYFFKRQLLWLGIGAAGMFIAACFPYKHWMKLSVPIMVATLLMLALLVVLKKGRLLVGQSVSPSELAKLAVVIYIGHWLSSKGELLRRLPYGLLPFTIMVGAIAGLVMAQPDTSEAVIIVMVSVAMFFLAGADVRQFLIGIGGGVAAFVVVIGQIPAKERLEPFFTGWQDPLTSSILQLRQGVIAFGSGGVFGMGPGSGRMKYWWLPLAHTDSIFAVVGEEMGLLGCLMLLGLFVVVTYRGFRIASQAPDLFGGLLATGITCWIAFQALINVAVVTGTMPFTGTALPFISVGGSSLVTCMIGVGIMLNVSRAAAAPKSRYGVRHATQISAGRQAAGAEH